MTLQVTLSEDLELYARQLVEAGRYASVGQVIEMALEIMRSSEVERLAVLKAEIQKGIDAFEAGQFRSFKTEEELRSYLATL